MRYLLALFFIYNLSFAQKKVSYTSSDIDWNSTETVFTQTKNSNKPYIISLYDKSYKSGLIDKETYADDKIKELLKNFTAVKFNKKNTVNYKGTSYKKYKTCNIRGLGCGSRNDFIRILTKTDEATLGTAFLDAEQKVIGFVPGYISATRLEKYINYVLSGTYKKAKNPSQFASVFPQEEGIY